MSEVTEKMVDAAWTLLVGPGPSNGGERVRAALEAAEAARPVAVRFEVTADEFAEAWRLREAFDSLNGRGFDELLALLAEECGEVVQLVGKSLRHGLTSYHPQDRDTSNRMLLEKELGDVLAVVTLLCCEGAAGDEAPALLTPETIALKASLKLDNLPKWLHHASVPPRATEFLRKAFVRASPESIEVGEATAKKLYQYFDGIGSSSGLTSRDVLEGLRKVFGSARVTVAGESAGIPVRTAARQRKALDGADAQALEHAITMTERERDAARAELSAAMARVSELEGDLLKWQEQSSNDRAERRTAEVRCKDLGVMRDQALADAEADNAEAIRARAERDRALEALDGLREACATGKGLEEARAHFEDKTFGFYTHQLVKFYDRVQAALLAHAPKEAAQGEALPSCATYRDSAESAYLDEPTKPAASEIAELRAQGEEHVWEEGSSYVGPHGNVTHYWCTRCKLTEVIRNVGSIEARRAMLEPTGCTSPVEPAKPEASEDGPDWRAVGDGAFACPFGTVRKCLDCGCLVAGGPTRCGRCAQFEGKRRKGGA